MMLGLPFGSSESSVDGASSTTIAGATRSPIATTCGIGLVAQQVDVDEIGTQATPADATAATDTALATTASADGADQRHQRPLRQQLGTLPLELSRVQCV
jgi:hypothetical protein